MQPAKLINGRTREQWAAYDRAHLIGSVALGLLLVVLPLAGRGPSPAGGCCGPPRQLPRSSRHPTGGAPTRSRATCSSRRTARS